MQQPVPADPFADCPSRREAAAVSLALSAVFLAVYNATNWITSLRSDVGTLRFDWERHIPFVPAMILPYMSIDLFFVAGPFLCSSRRELRILARRIALAIVAAGTGFLAFPLRLAVERPHVDGMMGAIFNAFRTVDLPYNLCPSLHIALWTILADLYARHTRGPTRWASHVWFGLIGISTLLTWQHHVVDVIGGFVLATICFYVVRETPLRTHGERNLRIGRWYAIGSALLIAAAIALRPWGLLLLWPAASTGLVAAAYFGLGPGIFRKERGRLPLSARFVLGPALLGQYLSLLHYRRQCRAWDAVDERVWIGRRLSDREAGAARERGVTAVVDLTAEFDEARPFLAIECLPLPVLDLTAPTQDQLQRAVTFIEEHVRHGIVYIHCKIGYSRSAAVVAAWLVATRRSATPDAAFARLRSARPSIVIRPEAEEAARRFAGYIPSSTTTAIETAVAPAATASRPL